MAKTTDYCWPHADIHNLTGPLKPGIHIVGSATGFGKSTFAANLVRHESFVARRPTVAFATEMPAREWLDHVVAQECNVPFPTVVHESERATLSPAQQLAVTQSQRRLDRQCQQRGLIVVGTRPNSPRVDAAQVGKAIRWLKAEGGRLLIVDHLDHVVSNGGASTRRPGACKKDELDPFLESVNATAMDAGIVVVALSQLNREGNEQLMVLAPPSAGWLASSSTVERIATSILVLGPAPKPQLTALELARLVRDASERRISPFLLHDPASRIVHCLKARHWYQSENRGAGSRCRLRTSQGRIAVDTHPDTHADCGGEG